MNESISQATKSHRVNNLTWEIGIGSVVYSTCFNFRSLNSERTSRLLHLAFCFLLSFSLLSFSSHRFPPLSSPLLSPLFARPLLIFTLLNLIYSLSQVHTLDVAQADESVNNVSSIYSLLFTSLAIV